MRIARASFETFFRNQVRDGNGGLMGDLFWNVALPHNICAHRSFCDEINGFNAKIRPIDKSIELKTCLLPLPLLRRRQSSVITCREVLTPPAINAGTNCSMSNGQ
jgi:hypothetical protein